ncbi:hypothetical protein M569_02181, partial [Genlisea aurea]
GTTRIKLNVGGKLFETTVTTLRSGGPDSLLSGLSSRRPSPDPIFIDRDPEIFSVLLSLLRSNRLPSAARRFSDQQLIEDALYFGIDSLLPPALAPSSLKGVDASLSATVRPSSDGIVSDFDVEDSNGSLHVAHGGLISVYDLNLNLTRTGTVRTHLDFIRPLKTIEPSIAAVGSGTTSGLDLYNTDNGRRVHSVEWVDPSDVRIFKARVHAIAKSEDSIFASYGCWHGENCTLAIDKSTMKVSSEIGRMSGNSSKTAAPSKLAYSSQLNLLIGIYVSSGGFGFSGYIRLWDLRSGDVVWETHEPGGAGLSNRLGDPFADVDVSSDESSLFKICSKSGDVATADLRKLSDDPWVYLTEKNPSLRNTGDGRKTVIHCYQKQAFVGRDGGLEVWSKVEENGVAMAYRRNHVDKPEDTKRGTINKIHGGGNRLLVTRQDVEGIEVWTTSHSSGV